VIYFIQAAIIGRIKIGFTSNDDFQTRMDGLQTGSPVQLRILATCPGSELEEKELHARFADYRVRGEWFRPGRRLVRLIASLQGRTKWERPHHGRSHRAEIWLNEQFAQHEEIASSELIASARDNRISRNALHEAKSRMGIVVRHRCNRDGNRFWVWCWLFADRPKRDEFDNLRMKRLLLT